MKENHGMEVHLSADQEAFVREGIKNGRYAREEDALQHALVLWEMHERRRAEILAAVDTAEMSFARSEGRKIATHQEARQLASEIQLRGLNRLNAAEKR
jgi:Arc/MetJ-type ribon-helix-helix transcriptional regulator